MDNDINDKNLDPVLDPVTTQNELLRRNLELNQEILTKTNAIMLYIKWQRIWSVVRALFVIVPIAIGVLYLPPLLKDYFDQFSSLYK